MNNSGVPEELTDHREMASADFQPVGNGVEDQINVAIGGFLQTGDVQGHR